MNRKKMRDMWSVVGGMIRTVRMRSACEGRVCEEERSEPWGEESRIGREKRRIIYYLFLFCKNGLLVARVMRFLCLREDSRAASGPPILPLFRAGPD